MMNKRSMGMGKSPAPRSKPSMGGMGKPSMAPSKAPAKPSMGGIGKPAVGPRKAPAKPGMMGMMGGKYNKGGMVKGMACGGMTKKGKK